MMRNLPIWVVIVAGVLSIAAIGISAVVASDMVPATAAAANVIILAITAIAVVFYTQETQRMADSTQSMAAATQDTLEQVWTLRECKLQLVRTGGDSERSSFKLINLGPGRARVLTLSWQGDELKCEHPIGPFVLDPGEAWDEGIHKIPAHTLYFSAQDDFGRECVGTLRRVEDDEWVHS